MKRFAHMARSSARGRVGVALLGALAGCSSNSAVSRDASSAGTGGNAATGGSTATAASAPSSSGGIIGGGGGATGGNATGGVGTGGVTTGTGGRTTDGGAMDANATGGSATGGSTTGGSTMDASATGGSTTGGNATGGNATGGITTGGITTATGGITTATGGSATGGSTGGATASITKDGESLLTNAGLTVISYGGYLNGESFQEDGIVSFNGYQYAAFWNTSRHVVMARRALPGGAWSAFEFMDYTNSADDAHNTISLGICPGDGTLHLSFDHHTSDLHYRKSAKSLLTNPGTAPWAAASFGAVTSNLVGTTAVTQVTYPRFVTEPGGGKMLFDARIGTSGSGDEYLWEYDSTSGAWTSLGMFVYGTVDSINAYPHGLSYTPGGTRLHMSYCWRETSDASTNHDLDYIYSDDHGRTWKNNAAATVATTGSAYVTKNSAGIKVWTINQNRGLINQEHMAVDATGRVHVLLSHMPDAQADDSNFDSARTKSQFFHYWRNATGTWTRTPMGLPVVASFRGKLAIAASTNLYAVLPDLRIAAASASASFATWTLLDGKDSGRFFSDPLIDTARLLTEDKLTVFYPQKSSPNIYVLDYTVK